MIQVVKRSWKRGQSTLEYLLIAAVIIAAVAAAANILIRPEVTKTLTSSSDAINSAATQIGDNLK